MVIVRHELYNNKKTNNSTNNLVQYSCAHVCSQFVLVLIRSVSTEITKLLENYNLQYNSSHDLEGRAVYIS